MVFDSFSFFKWHRLTRFVAWVSRFFDNCRISKEERSHGELTHEKIKNTEARIIRKVQQNASASEYQQILKGKQINNDSKLINLQPCIDEEGLLWSNGRLRYSDFLPYDARHPILLPGRTGLQS